MKENGKDRGGGKGNEDEWMWDRNGGRRRDGETEKKGKKGRKWDGETGKKRIGHSKAGRKRWKDRGRVRTLCRK